MATPVSPPQPVPSTTIKSISPIVGESISFPVVDEVKVFDGEYWVNKTKADAGLSEIGHSHTGAETEFHNDDTAEGATVSLSEGSVNGANKVLRKAADSMASDYTIEESATVAVDHDGVLFEVAGTVQTVKHSKWANAIAVVFENNGSFSTTADSGFQ